MKGVKLSALLAMLFSVFFVTLNTTAEALTRPDFKECYSDPIPRKNGAIDMDRVNEEILIPNGIPKTITVGGTKRSINVDILYKRHMVIYGSYFGDDFEGYLCDTGIKMNRYMGYSQNGNKIPEMYYRNDTGATSSTYLTHSNFIWKPWKGGGEYFYENWLRESKAGRTSMPEPKAPPAGMTDEDYKHPVDHQKSTGVGDFAKPNVVEGNPMIGWVLKEFASIQSPPTKFSPGVFTLYTHSTHPNCNWTIYKSGGVCYSVWPIKQRQDPFVGINNALIKNNTVKTSYVVGEDLSGKVTVTNDFKTQAIDLPCQTTPAQGHAGCYSTYTAGSLVLYKKGTNTRAKITVNGQERDGYSLNFTMLGHTSNTLNPKASFSGDLSRLGVSIPEPGEYDLEIAIQNYKGESTFDNNRFKVPIKVGSSNDASVNIGLKKTKFGSSEPIDANINVVNGLNGKIDAPCKSSPNIQCKSQTSNVDFTVEIKKGSEVVYNKEFKYSGIEKQKTHTLLFSQEALKLPAGSYTMKAKIPYYVGEVTWDNNSAIVNFTIEGSENAKVDIQGDEETAYREAINHPVVVTNNMNSTKDIQLTVKAQSDSGNNYGGTKTKVLTGMKPNETRTVMLGEFNMVASEGKKTTVNVSITEFAGEITWDDNHDSIELIHDDSVFIPENTKCDGIDMPNMHYNGTYQSLSKFCVGYAPNFPSTLVEGGQGTFFYIGYRLFPMPLPAYEVTTHDELGAIQTVMMNEPYDKLGSCDASNLTSDTKCDIRNTFLNYPSKYETVYKNHPEKLLNGPYLAGSGENSHYLYRGRMFAKQVNFFMKIYDPKGNEVPSAVGQLTFEVDPETCYRKDALDMHEHCRNIDFYFPISDVTVGTPNNPLMIPEESDARSETFPAKFSPDRLQFLNPGRHTLDIDVAEVQVYRYQFDDYNKTVDGKKGGEWQGKQGELRDRWTGDNPDGASKSTWKDPIRTMTTKKESSGEIKWVPQDEYKNHCYSNTDGFGKTGDFTGSGFNNTNSDRDHCYHNASSDFYNWHYRWSEPMDWFNEGYLN